MNQLPPEYIPPRPPPLAAWVVQRVRFPEGEPGGRRDFRFVWTGAGASDLDAFPYARACEAALAMAPNPRAGEFPVGRAVRQVGIAATGQRRPFGPNPGYWKGRAFDIAGRRCGIATQEIGA